MKNTRVRSKKDYKKRHINGAAKLLYAINYLGRYCKHCNLDGFDCPWFMDFHHRNPQEKVYEVKNKVMHHTFNTVKSEVDKCDLLCGKCHRQLHSRTDLLELYKNEIEKQFNKINTYNGIVINDRSIFSKEEDNKLIECINASLSINKTSKIINKGTYATRKRADFLGLKFKINKYNTKSKDITNVKDKPIFDIELVYQMYKNGQSLRSIGKLYNISYMAVRARLTRAGKFLKTDNLHKEAVIRENKRRAKK